MRKLILVAVAVVGLAVPPATAEETPGIPAGYKLVYEQNFDDPRSLQDFVVTDPLVWKHAHAGSNGWLELTYDRSKPSPYQPKHRSPFNIALLGDRVFSDFVMEVELQSTVKPTAHQDMCLFYNFTDPQRFYYTHMAVAADPHAHNIFIVNEAPRKAIAQETTKGITWGEGKWHKVRVARDNKAGTIKIYFDDLTKPLMIAEDRTFTSGHVGVGSFDDSGRIDNLRIWAPAVEMKKAPFFKRIEN